MSPNGDDETRRPVAAQRRKAQASDPNSAMNQIKSRRSLRVYFERGIHRPTDADEKRPGLA
eukprot:530230-Alexandrium_andersonii.AAC.1